MTICTRCYGTGFLNTFQIPDGAITVDDPFVDTVLAWIESQTEPHDVQVCDCCGDGEEWHGVPGMHYGADDPPGDYGPYAYNGGLSECN